MDRNALEHLVSGRHFIDHGIARGLKRRGRALVVLLDVEARQLCRRKRLSDEGASVKGQPEHRGQGYSGKNHPKTMAIRRCLSSIG
jgi:hypothetical protein